MDSKQEGDIKMESFSLYEKLNEFIEAKKSFVLVTLVDVRGSAPQVVGAKAMVDSSGLVTGTVGGGKVELKAIDFAQNLLECDPSKQTAFETWNLQRDVGMTCGGEVKFFFEVFFCHDWRVVIFGAGHVSQALTRLFLTLDCQLTCIDTRKEWLDLLPESPRLTKVHSSCLEEEVSHLHPNSYILLMTQGHSTDLPILQSILEQRDPPFLGVIGSRVKGIKLRSELKKRGLSQEKVDSFHCPLGLPFGNNTPPEIAISMISQVMQERDLRARESS